MDKRRIKKRRYIAAFIITASIFAIGLFFGFLMENIRVDYFQQQYENQELDFRSLQLQHQLANSELLENQCGGIRELFDIYIKELENTRERLDVYNKDAQIKKEEFNIMKRKYTLAQINFWYVSNLLKESCPQEADFITILYFYSDEKECPRCNEQATILDFYKLKLKEKLLIFALDSQFKEEPTIELLLETYDINSFPGLIIDGKKYNFLTREELGEILCNKIEDESLKEICEKGKE